MSIKSDSGGQVAPFDYQSEALQTLSKSWHGGRIDRNMFTHDISMAIRALRVLDAYKRALYYGDFGALAIERPGAIDGDYPLPDLADDAVHRDLLHAVVGAATEAGELLDVAYDCISDDGTIDAVNACEEFGDVFWYAAIGANALNTTIHRFQLANRAKLRQRFPDSFTEYDAQNRDLIEETKILDESINKKS